jgi:hypothetical protein
MVLISVRDAPVKKHDDFNDILKGVAAGLL